MADVFSREKRSFVMSRIRSRGNATTELRVIALFRQRGITGWRRNVALAGRPDFVFRREHVVVFVDGCFWHGCPRCYRAPSTNNDYWRSKVVRIRQRDRAVSRRLRADGWAVVRVWEHALSKPVRFLGTLGRLLSQSGL
jgi:DNA mismatch endonuclease (patch repair protein)